MIRLHLSQSPGPVRAINGVNLGPLHAWGALDFTESFRESKVASVRTHDCNILSLDTVDLHCIFPDPKADPDDAANYHFLLTDDYLAAIGKTGAEIYFRLGETIERGRKTYVTAGRWKPETLARVCLNIARHYNEGWANGFEWNIAHWQFWNEPNNRWMSPVEDRPCWTGSTEEFYTLYGAVARAFKAHNPAWHIGLAGFGRPFFVFPKGHVFYAEQNPWRHFEPILNSGPIDSISWHQYGHSWEDLAQTASMVRTYLDANGLPHAENHITEWNYMPWLEDEQGKYTWFHARSERNYDRLDRIVEVMRGVEGAAYVFGSLLRLQREAVDLAHLYTGVSGDALGLFSPNGRPHPKYEGFVHFASFIDQPRVEVTGGDAVFSPMATLTNGNLEIGIAHLRPEQKEVVLFADGEVTLDQGRQYSSDGWSHLVTSTTREGGGTRITVPITGSGLTRLSGRVR